MAVTNSNSSKGLDRARPASKIKLAGFVMSPTESRNFVKELARDPVYFERLIDFLQGIIADERDMYERSATAALFDDCLRPDALTRFGRMKAYNDLCDLFISAKNKERIQ